MEPRLQVNHLYVVLLGPEPIKTASFLPALHLLPKSYNSSVPLVDEMPDGSSSYVVSLLQLVNKECP